MNSEAHLIEGELEAGGGITEPLSSQELPQAGETVQDACEHHTEIVPAFATVSTLATETLTQPPPLPDHLKQIPFQLELRVPLSHFTLRDLQKLKAGDLLLTEHLSVRDLVLTAAGQRLLLVELEAIEQQLAARVKRLAWRHKWRRQA